MTHLSEFIPSFYPSTLSYLCGFNLRWQQTKQRRQNVCCPGHILQWFRGNLAVFAGYSMNIISPACPESSAGSPLNHAVGLLPQEVTTGTDCLIAQNNLLVQWLLREVMSLLLNFHTVGISSGLYFHTTEWLFTLMHFRRFKIHLNWEESPYLAANITELVAVCKLSGTGSPPVSGPHVEM